MKNILIILFVIFGSIQLQAQIKIIEGTLTDTDNLPLPGVNVIVKGTDYGTTTDFDGKYKILVKVNDVLVFNYVGSIQQRFVLNTLETLSFKMSEPYLEELYHSGCNFRSSRIADHITYQYVKVKLNR